MTARVAAILVLLALTGCTRYYYYKDAATYGDFAVDHSGCVRDIGIPSANREHVLVSPEAYRRCMFTRGWVRAKQTEPVEPGWYRGIERERVLGFDTPPPPPPPTVSRPTTDMSEAECRRIAIAGLANRPEYRGCPR
jgi:hypothetical protein